MKFNTKEIYNAVVIEVIGKLMGGPEAEDFHKVLEKAISEDKKIVLVDLSDVKFVNSSGLGILVRGLTTMKTAGGDLRIAGISDKVKGVLSITKLTSVFNLYENIEAAAKG